MSRDHLIIVGALAWSLVALDVVIHLILGDLVAPAAMAAILVAWVAFRRVHPSREAVTA